MSNRFFPSITAPIAYEGPATANPLAFRWYDAKRVIAGKTMAEHLRFAVCYWHTFCGTGSDPFGGPSYERAWHLASDPLVRAEQTLEAAFEFFSKLGAPYWCFHDRDIAPEGANQAESAKNLAHIVAKAGVLQRETGIKLLWGTANLFSHQRYNHGASTNPDPLVFAHGAAQVRRALDATIALGGTGYVFWGGREGYSMLLNTDQAQERKQYATLLRMAITYARANGFTGRFFIEPKPKEPSVHQYDSDVAGVLGFLREFDLWQDVDINVEANHATLAGHSFEHELQTASAVGKLGSIDVNRGNPLLGWDTDQFPTDVPSAVMAMLVVRAQGGLTHGGLNFDAKVRRGSTDPVDLFHGHIGGMDTFARGLLIAERMRADGFPEKGIATRYAGWREGLGAKILAGKATLEEAETWARTAGEPELRSGREELLENRFNQYLDDSTIR